jgi:hypothetical protein
MGPLLVGEPAGLGKTRLTWILPDGLREARVPFATLEGLVDGDRVLLRNLRRETNHLVPMDEKRSHALVRQGRFRVAIGADAIPGTARRAILGFDPSFNMREQGLGCEANVDCIADADLSTLDHRGL